MTVGEIKKGVLHEMREYSNSGTVQSETDIKDYLLSIIPLLNIYQRELATTTNKIKREYEISHNMPDNQLGKIVWNEDRVHVGGVDDEFVQIGTRAYSLQAAGHFSYQIQEEVDGEWVTRINYTHTPTTGEGYVTKKGLTNIVDPNNRVKLVFNSPYRHPFRWIGMFTDNFYDDNEVPKFEPYVPYELPSNFYREDRVEVSKADRQLVNYTTHKYSENGSNKSILLNWYDKGEFRVHYFAYPAVIPEPNPNNLAANDNLTLDIADECGPALIHRIAATLMRDENPYMADTLAVEAQIAKAELVQNSSFAQGENGIIINSNW